MQHKAARAYASVKYEGVNITKDITEDLISMNYTDNLDSADELELNIKDINRKWLKEWHPRKGDKIDVTIIGEHWDNFGDLKTYPCGSFQVDAITYSGPPSIISIKAISVDIKANYKDEKRNKSWENVTLKDIVSEITRKANKSLIYEVENIIKYKRVDQSLESDLQLLKRLCEQEGLSLKSAVDKLIVFNKEKYEKEEALGIIELTPYLNFTIDSDDADTYDSCIIEYYDSTLKETLRGEFKAPEREGYKENTNRVLRVKENNSVPGDNKEEKEAFLAKKAKSKLRSKNSNETKVNISNRKGDFITWAGSTVTLVNFGVYSGKYVVNKITRTIGDSGYKQSLELNKTLEY